MNNSEVARMSETAKIIPMKQTATVLWSEVEPLFNRIRTSLDVPIKEVLHTIGYDSSSSVAKWQASGRCPLRVKYALLGMAAELAVPAPKSQAVTWSHSELADLFGLTIGLILPDGAVRHLQAKLATALQEEQSR